MGVLKSDSSDKTSKVALEQDFQTRYVVMEVENSGVVSVKKHDERYADSFDMNENGI